MQEEQEVELIDYLNVIWKRKGLIVGGTLLAAATALVVSLSMPKVYEVSRTLRIGVLPGGIYENKKLPEKAIQNREVVVDRLRDQRLLTRAIQELQLEMTPKDMAGLVSIDTKSNPNVRYKVQAPDPQLATRIADWLAETIIKAHGQVFNRGIQIEKKHEAGLAVTIRTMEAGISGMKSTLASIMRAPKIDAPTVILLQGNIEKLEQGLASLRRELKQTRLSRLRYESTSLTAADAPPQQPVKPGVKLNVALASALGLMIFTFLAFFLEYIEKAKRREN